MFKFVLWEMVDDLVVAKGGGGMIEMWGVGVIAFRIFRLIYLKMLSKSLKQKIQKKCIAKNLVVHR